MSWWEENGGNLSLAQGLRLFFSFQLLDGYVCASLRPVFYIQTCFGAFEKYRSVAAAKAAVVPHIFSNKQLLSERWREEERISNNVESERKNKETRDAIWSAVGNRIETSPSMRRGTSRSATQRLPLSIDMRWQRWSCWRHWTSFVNWRYRNRENLYLLLLAAFFLSLRSKENTFNLCLASISRRGR